MSSPFINIPNLFQSILLKSNPQQIKDQETEVAKTIIQHCEKSSGGAAYAACAIKVMMDEPTVTADPEILRVVATAVKNTIKIIESLVTPKQKDTKIMLKILAGYNLWEESPKISTPKPLSEEELHAPLTNKFANMSICDNI